MTNKLDITNPVLINSKNKLALDCNFFRYSLYLSFSEEPHLKSEQQQQAATALIIEQLESIRNIGYFSILIVCVCLFDVTTN